MAGVVQEIDLVLAQQAVAKATADAAAAGKKIGAATGQGMISSTELKQAEQWFNQQYPAAAEKGGKAAAKKLTEALNLQFKIAQADISEGIARGLLTPAQAKAKGVEAAQNFNVGLLSQMDKVGAAGGFSGAAGQQQFVGLAGQLKSVGAEGEKAARGLATMRSGILQTGLAVANAQGPLGTFINGLLTFSGGGGITLAIAAGLGVVALAVSKITEAANKGRKAADDLLQSLKNVGRSDFIQAFDKINDVERKIAETEKRILDIQNLRAAGGGPAGGVPFDPNRFGVAISDKQLEAELKRLDELRDRLRALRKEFPAGSVDPGTLSAGAGHTTPDGQPTNRLTGKTQDERDRAKREADAADKRAIEENIRLLEKEAQRQLQIAEQARTVSQEAQHALADLTTTAIDNLQLQIDEFQARVMAVWDHLTPEQQKATQRVIDAWKAQLAEAKILEPINQEALAFAHSMENADFKVIKFEDHWKKVGDIIATVGQGILDMARGLGLVSNQMSKVAQGAIDIGRNLEKAAKGDPAAILGIVGGGVSLVGGLFGFHKSKDPERLAKNQELYDRAVDGDANALDELWQRSGRKDSKHGLGSQKAKDDAWEKYQAAKQAQSAAGAPAAAAQAEQQRLDQLRAAEEAQVTAHSEAERKAHITDIVGTSGLTGPQREMADQLRKLEQEFERLVAASPLGADSPLAREAKQKADDAASALDRSIADAKRAAGQDVTAGYTVQRTVTESSAGRLVGEAITTNIWLERIFGRLGGMDTVSVGSWTGTVMAAGQRVTDGMGGAPAADVLSRLDLIHQDLLRGLSVEMDGQLVSRIIGGHQAGAYQRLATLAGNTLLPS